jgi:hypothetical protein
MATSRLILLLSVLLFACSSPPHIEREPLMYDDEYFDDSYVPLHDDPLDRARGPAVPVGRGVVSPVEARNGPWSGDNQLGFTLPFAPDAENRQTILKLDEWGMPQVWSIMLGRTQFDGEVGELDVKAELEIGCGGTTQRVRVDWINGTVIRAPMNALNVIARYDFAVGGVILDGLRLTATLGRGTVGGLPPTYSVEVPEIDPAALGDLLELPPFAKSVDFVKRSSSEASPFDAGIEYRFVQEQGFTRGSVSGTEYASYHRGIPIPPRATKIRIDNNTASAVRGWLIYTLAL